MANLVTVPGVELIRTGKWNISTGEWEVTPDLITAAIDAHTAGVLRKPVIRLGHNDPRFTGDPAVGYVDNLRASADGHMLLGDLVGVPQWLADIMASAYPDRSVEGLYDYTAPDGSEHPFVLTGLALLGATRPGVESLKSLQDVARLYDVAAAGGGHGTPVMTVPTGSGVWSGFVGAFPTLPNSVPLTDPLKTPVGQAFAADKKPYGDVTYADPGYQSDGKKRYPLDTKDHVRAAWSYINMPRNAGKYSKGQLARVKSKIRAAAKRLGIEIQAAAVAGTGKGAVMASLKEEIAQRLGIAADADDGVILAGLDEALAEVADDAGGGDAGGGAAPPAEPTTQQIAAAAEKAGLVLVDSEQYKTTVAAVVELQKVEAARRREQDEQFIDTAIVQGKIAPASREHHLKLLEVDRDGHRQVLASLPEGLLPVKETGHSVGQEAVDNNDELLYSSLFPEGV